MNLPEVLMRQIFLIHALKIESEKNFFKTSLNENSSSFPRRFLFQLPNHPWGGAIRGITTDFLFVVCVKPNFCRYFRVSGYFCPKAGLYISPLWGTHIELPHAIEMVALMIRRHASWPFFDKFWKVDDIVWLWHRVYKSRRTLITYYSQQRL